MNSALLVKNYFKENGTGIGNVHIKHKILDLSTVSVLKNIFIFRVFKSLIFF